jgi:hypothetical protein
VFRENEIGEIFRSEPWSYHSPRVCKGKLAADTIDKTINKKNNNNQNAKPPPPHTFSVPRSGLWPAPDRSSIRRSRSRVALIVSISSSCDVDAESSVEPPAASDSASSTAGRIYHDGHKVGGGTFERPGTCADKTTTTTTTTTQIQQLKYNKLYTKTNIAGTTSLPPRTPGAPLARGMEVREHPAHLLTRAPGEPGDPLGLRAGDGLRGLRGGRCGAPAHTQLGGVPPEHERDRGVDARGPGEPRRGRQRRGGDRDAVDQGQRGALQGEHRGEIVRPRVCQSWGGGW